MSFRVRITDTARKKLFQLDEPVDVKIALLSAIESDLGNLPRLNGFRSIAPVRFHTHRVVLKHPHSGDQLRYLIWVDDCYQEEGTRTVMDANKILSDQAYWGMTPVKGAQPLPRK